MQPATGRITLKQGGGGRAMRALIERLFVRDFATLPFDGVGIAAMDDGAAIRFGDDWLVITTDSHVIHPIFFPGGDIGRLSICGTVNDLAMMGATNVLALTCSVILEEGFALESLEAIQQSMIAACREARAPVVTGDTKVMGRRELDGVVINTCGIGLTPTLIRDNGLSAGDRIIVTGNIAEHGLAVMAARHAIGIEGNLVSDVAPMNTLIASVLGTGAITAMKDPTRGGVSSALHEMASKSGVGIVLDERAVPITAAVRAVGELLGIDPLHVANEGKALMGVRADRADEVLQLLHAHPLGRSAAIIGTCNSERLGSVILDTGFGKRLLAEPEGEPLPRIC
ncbi:MAG: hydrogenase expression/formation protein HypE [Acidobacteria bacterium]|nr:hydrogenase expression/formation protein HypE [Acidobacteriota bacterium]MBV9188386.1 hydrogenase expression/formation protein HypE [Acidobacteriota bacterium]